MESDQGPREVSPPIDPGFGLGEEKPGESGSWMATSTVGIDPGVAIWSPWPGDTGPPGLPPGEWDRAARGYLGIEGKHPPWGKPKEMGVIPSFRPPRMGRSGRIQAGPGGHFTRPGVPSGQPLHEEGIVHHPPRNGDFGPERIIKKVI